MRLPKDILSGMYTKPRLFLCETDDSRICQLQNQNLNGNFSFNSVSELNFEVSRFYNDMLTGEIKVNPFYDKVEGLRLVELENFGLFEIQGPTLSGDGINEIKSVNAQSLEYTLSNKYLTSFYINTGEIGSVEVTYAEEKALKQVIEKYGTDYTEEQFQTEFAAQLKPVEFYSSDPKLSLLNLVLEKAYGWSVGHVDASLKTLTRKFEVDRQSVYDFIMNDVCSSFNCYAVFDTLNKTINFYSESLTSKFVGDGTTTEFTVSPPFAQVHTVSVGGYKTTQWNYDASTGVLVFDEAPEDGAHIEIVDGGLKAWETDVFITFDNLTQSVDVSYDADSIKTVLTVKFGDNENIREVNFGSSDLVDLSYYHTVDWMGQDLYDRYTEYLQYQNSVQNEYAKNSKEILELENRINFETNKMSLEYGITQAVTSTTVGEYYVRRGTAPNYYFVKVDLPGEYNATETYYKDGVVNVTEDRISNFYTMLQKYFYEKPQGDEEDDDLDGYDEWFEYFKEKVTIGGAEFDNEFRKDFKFVETELLALKEGLDSAFDDVRNRKKYDAADECIKTFLNRLWAELGKAPLEEMFLDSYKKIQSTNLEAGWGDTNSNNYSRYYPVLLMIETIENAIKERDAVIEECKNQQKPYQDANSELSANLNMNTFFNEEQLLRLNTFLREDELNLDDIIITDLDSLADSFKMQQHAMESGKIELNKLCQPQLSFSMTMANIYALPEFEPIVHQFQLGKVIKIGIRDDYVKQSRLLGVNIDFEDFSNFSVEFGELTNLTKQSDIHADLLSKAIQAGKEVASSSGIWTSGADMATETDLKIQQGLISATNSIKSIDGTQAVEWDNYGIHLRKWANSDKSEYDPHQAWFVNNRLLFTDDGWKTSRAGIGEFDINGKTQYGVIADAMLAGYIQGSHIKGGDICIGEQDDGTYAFQVNDNGNFNFGGSKGIVYNSEDQELTLGSDVTLTWGQIEEKPDIPSKVSDLDNDEGYLVSSDMQDAISESLTGYLNEGNYSTYVTKDWIGTLGLAVGSEIQMGPNAKISWNNVTGTDDIATQGDIPTHLSQLANDAGFATTNDIPVNVSDLINDSRFQNFDEVVQISKDTIDAPFIRTLKLKVGTDIEMGPNAKISWNNVTDTDDIATNDGVQSKINDIKIGGRNLITNGNTSYLSNAVHGLTYTPIDGYKSAVHISGTTTEATATKSIIGFLASDKFYIKKNVPYTISVVGLPSGVKWQCTSSKSNGTWGAELHSKTTDTHVTVSLPDEDVYTTFRYINMEYLANTKFDCDVYIKIEEGNKATDWSPSPEDVTSAIPTDEYITTITQNSITSEYIKGLNLEVGNQIKMGSNATIDWGKITGTSNIATKGDIPTDAYITTITQNSITSEYIKSLNLKVGSEIQMGPSAKIAWSNVTGTSNIATKGDIPTESQITTITNNAISTAYISASKINSGTLTVGGRGATGGIAIVDSDGNGIGMIGSNGIITTTGYYSSGGQAIEEANNDDESIPSGTEDIDESDSTFDTNSYMRLISGGSTGHIYVGRAGNNQGIYSYLGSGCTFGVYAGTDKVPRFLSYRTYVTDSKNNKTYGVRFRVPCLSEKGKTGSSALSRTTSSANVHVTAAGILQRITSSSRTIKHDITTEISPENDPHRLYDLPFVQYKYNEDIMAGDDQRYMKDIPGLIAEDVEQHYWMACELDKNGKPIDWNVRYLVPPMLKLIQEQHEEIESLKERIEALEKTSK